MHFCIGFLSYVCIPIKIIVIRITRKMYWPSKNCFYEAASQSIKTQGLEAQETGNSNESPLVINISVL